MSNDPDPLHSDSSTFDGADCFNFPPGTRVPKFWAGKTLEDIRRTGASPTTSELFHDIVYGALE